MAWSFTVLGGGEEIGANAYLLEIDGLSFLLDAGLHPKKYGQESLPDYGGISGELEAIFISHAHLDHVGSLPLINRQHPQASIFATLPTKEISLRMLHNTVTVMNIFRKEKGYLEYPFFSLMRQGQIPSVPLYLSGLGKSITEIYQDHRRYLRQPTSIFDFELFSVLGWLDDLAVETLLRKPCVIVATKGMMVENTPSARIARLLVQEERHAIFFCGYIDPDTLGYRVFHAQPGEELTFSPESEPVRVRTPNIKRFYLSSHADRYELLELARKVHPRNIILVHGEKEGLEFMQEELAGESQIFRGEKGGKIFLD